MDAVLLDLVERANLARARLGLAPSPGDLAAERALETAWRCSERLAVYGTLAPGGSNHDQLDGCQGTWQPAAVPGRRAVRRFPVFTFDATAPLVDVQLFVSRDLPRHWQRLDRFEGPGYCRILVPVFQHGSLLAVANLYAVVAPG